MSRELLNNKYCVRCGKKDPTPYLKKYSYMFQEGDGWESRKVVDIGCGNGRNSEYMKKLGFTDVTPVDMKPDYGVAITLGKDPLPAEDKKANIILANYVFMFLNKKELNQVLDQIKRIAADDCILMFELYAAKDSSCKDMDALVKYRDHVAKRLGWDKIRYAKEHCILKKP